MQRVIMVQSSIFLVSLFFVIEAEYTVTCSMIVSLRYVFWPADHWTLYWRVFSGMPASFRPFCLAEPAPWLVKIAKKQVIVFPWQRFFSLWHNPRKGMEDNRLISWRLIKRQRNKS